MSALVCPGCQGSVAPSLGRKPRKWCSETCRVRAAERASGNTYRVIVSAVSFPTCATCSRVFSARAGGRRKRATCSDDCYRQWRAAVQREVHRNLSPAQAQARLARKAKRRALTVGANAEVFTYAEVFERDAWVCGLCDEPVDRDRKHPDPMCASLDHVVPLAMGGHHVLANVQCAHLVCNIRKGARAVA